MGRRNSRCIFQAEDGIRDLVRSRGLGDVYKRQYPGLDKITRDSKRVGEWLSDKSGTLWVNSMWAQIYLYAGKKPTYGMMEIIEVNDVATERRQLMVEQLVASPPDWIVTVSYTHLTLPTISSV